MVLSVQANHFEYNINVTTQIKMQNFSIFFNNSRLDFLFLCLFSLIFCPLSIEAQSLKLEDIMRGNDYIGHTPSRPIWSLDEQKLFFLWQRDSQIIQKWYTYDLAKKSIKLSTPAERQQEIVGSDLSWNRSKTTALYEKNGDIYLFDKMSKKSRILLESDTYESNPKWGDKNNIVYFQKDQNIIRFNLDTPSLSQVTFLKTKKEDSRSKSKTPSEKWVEEDNMKIMEVLSDRKKIREENKSYQNSLTKPKGLFIGEKELSTLQINPNGRTAFVQLTERANNRETEVPDFLTEDGYVRSNRIRPKVGETPNSYEFYLLNLALDTFKVIDFAFLPGIKTKPKFLQDYHRDTLPFQPQYKNPKPIYVSQVLYSPDGDHCVAEVFSFDNKDRWLVHIGWDAKENYCIDHQHDEAWIGGPTVAYEGFMTFAEDKGSFYFTSEESGFSHLYQYHFSDKKTTQITKGNFEIQDIEYLDLQNMWLIHANKVDLRQSHAYILDKNNNLVPLWQGEGKYEATLSPLGSYYNFMYSNSTTPPELFIAPSLNITSQTQITFSQNPEFAKQTWIKPKFVHIKAQDGTSVPARLYTPLRTQGGPAVIFVHGAGYLQNAHKWWSSYTREYMFHNFLVSKGFTVLDIDYRASAGYGRDWRTAIYRHMGGIDLTDQIDGTLYLIDSLGIDKNKIGIYGGSYGGFITLMALFKYPGVFKCGAALRSVTDWAHYNHGYTSNILNTPIEDSIAYKRSSPIYFADGLQDRLLMLHGMYDTNVQFQDVVRLSQRLIELKKERWDLAVFPVEDHGFKENSSWLDEYRRIYQLFLDHLK